MVNRKSAAEVVDVPGYETGFSIMWPFRLLKGSDCININLDLSTLANNYILWNNHCGSSGL